jgi:hypothetical protein
MVFYVNAIPCVYTVPLSFIIVFYLILFDNWFLYDDISAIISTRPAAPSRPNHSTHITIFPRLYTVHCGATSIRVLRICPHSSALKFLYTHTRQRRTLWTLFKNLVASLPRLKIIKRPHSTAVIYRLTFRCKHINGYFSQRF